MTINKNYIFQSAFILFLMYLPQTVSAHQYRDLLMRLDGGWKFSIGDNREWAKPDFEDNAWENIKVPSAWEDQGFYGYDGYAWYRNSFVVTREMKTKDLYLSLGYIDDVDQVYINGKLIGFSGSFPPAFSTATDARRKYPIPEEYLNYSGKNVIAVRVYNHQLAGGIISGEIGIVSNYTVKPDFSIFGLWSIRSGDNKLWKEPHYKDKSWHKIVVPGNWENQGYKDYDGVAWYRRHFILPEDLTMQKLVLIIGKIENYDEVYINGVLIGATGKIPSSKGKSKEKSKPGFEYRKSRVYSIPKNLLHHSKQNTIAIKVYNIRNRGGIVDGPIGFVKLTNFNRYFKEFGELEP